DLAKVHDALARVMPSPNVIELSARTGAGMEKWVAWLEELKRPIVKGHGHHHHHDHDHDHHDHGHKHGHDH
ncbi:MAG TPA: hydrogenase accessory protein HypB, partial [Anaeromyxobacteraceae bacterium]|nr:hydrogenase accessory protein HypB [Anaeromyxobacteraceae bacterium]